MVETATITINPDFVKWYRTVGVDENRERLEARFKGVQALLKAATYKDVETLIKLAFSTKQRPSSESLERVSNFFKQFDDLFDARDDKELKLLSASALTLLLESSSHVLSLTGLSIKTTACGGARTPNLPMDLPGLAEQALANSAERRRDRPDITKDKLVATKITDIEAHKTKLSSTFDAESVNACIDVLSENLKKSITAVIQQSNTALSQFSDYIKVQDEELELLWWIFGERSIDLDKSFKDIPVDQRALVLAKEMADNTYFLPGPLSTKALLCRTGISQKKTKLTAAISACETSWLESLKMPDEANPVVLPIHFGIARRLETNDEAAWIAGWSGATGIDQNLSLSGIELSLLFYSEQLIVQFDKGG